MPTLVLVDGSSYLYRAFHALPDLRTRNGEPTGALRGVLSMLRRLVEDGKPDYFAVVFDAPGKTFRDAWYPEYKANRPPMPDDLARQIEPLHALVRAHGWPLLMVEGVEADDVIGTLATQAAAAGIDTVISSSDKDLTQLVRPGITMVNTMSNETYDEAGVRAKFDVRPDQVLDLLTLTGDAVDNVPGVAKVGPKTAAKWLAQYGTLDDIVAHADEIGGVVGANLRAALPWLPQGRRLLTVKTDCALPVKPTDLAITPADAALIRALYERFEFRSWLRDSAGGGDAKADAADAIAKRAATDDAGRRWDTAADPAPAAVPAAPAEKHYETVLDEPTLARWLAAIDRAALTAFDTETTSLDPMQARIVGVSLAVEPGRACYIPLAHRYTGAPDQLDRAATLARLAPWLADPAKPKLGQNLKYDEHALANDGLVLRGVAHDTLLESYVLEAHRPHDMDSLAWRHLNVKTIAYDDVTGKGANRIGFDEVAVDRATEYSAEDADITLRLHDALHPAIAADAKLDYVYREIEMPVREVLFRMERNGILVDTTLLARQSRELGEKVIALEQQAHQLAGQPFNLGSPKQLGEILFQRMGLPVLKKTATGQPSTDEEVLAELAENYPLPRVLLEHRTVSKLKSTYTDKLPQMVNPATGRVHTTFAQATAVTGRLASSDPNLQNIPVRTPEGRRIREAFVAPPGHLLVSADYSQVELRIMAHLSGDPALVRAFHEGQDIHRATAAEIFGVAPAAVTPEQRRYIKAVNFGLIYGMGAFGLAQQLGLERGAAQQFIDRYFARYPGVAEYMQRTRELAREQGYVETVFGRRLFLPDIRAASGPRRAGAERAAINAPMQGTAADLVKLAMIAVQGWLDRERLGTKLLLQVHDELVLEVPDAEQARVLRELPPLMTGVAELSVPLVVDVGAGANWDKAH
ncbi:MAG: DNA polymerase I [Betaproteobacteria bacterium]|nr:DNA polymerase I [Betaproteobacteria bacterium]MCC7216488.1 DNA polymerase I [Burkholderiales bacterium]